MILDPVGLINQYKPSRWVILKEKRFIWLMTWAVAKSMQHDECPARVPQLCHNMASAITWWEDEGVKQYVLSPMCSLSPGTLARFSEGMSTGQTHRHMDTMAKLASGGVLKC